MRKVFIADAHLRCTEDENYRKLLRFLRELPGDTETLFILGDLFEFWIGYQAEAFPHYRPILDELLRLRARGVKIVYFEGNHDFHLGPFFEKTLGATIYPGPAHLVLDGKRVCLCHGDEINRRDYSYRLLRLAFHSGFTSGLIRLVPARWATAIAAALGGRSRARHGERRHRWDYHTILREFATERFADGCDIVITGHFHLPVAENAAFGPGRTLLSLGDWITHYTYGEMTDGVITLKTYR